MLKIFARKHKYHLGTFLILLMIAAVSGYFAFGTPDTDDRIQNADNKIQTNDDTFQDTSSATNDIAQNTINKTQLVDDTIPGASSTAKNTGIGLQVTSYKLQGKETTDNTTLIINGEKLSAQIITTTTVYDLMSKLKSENTISFSGKEYSGMGMFVEEINGVKNDNLAGKYWIYYVNGQSAQVGISSYIIKPNDLIEWKYETTNL